ncbi:MAG: tRNA pseudouridine(55) synthase TruB [Actinomycetota bacterium]|nr:tRNA pseudouridine(55) synthase TruB [Actinomycetota bacterium]
MLVDKPAGVTSHDVVARVRRERPGKVGHAGTLDPFATGLLIVLLGRATRLQRFLLELPKTYVATARLGWISTTGDPDGELTETGAVPDTLELPTGELEQQVPMTSAVKVNGERLYKKAHRGETIETPSRTVTVHRAELLESSESRASFEIECSSGTYVRTLIETLGDAYCDSLRRTAIGPFRVADGDEREIRAEELVAFLPERVLDAEEAALVGHGRAVAGEPSDHVQGAHDHVRLSHDGDLIAIARRDGDNLRPEVVFR